MRENRLRTLWKNDQAAVNGWLAVPNAFSAEVMAHQGWDTLTIDMQHGVIDYAQMVGMLQAISTTATVPICLLYTSPSPRDRTRSRMPSSA